MENNYVEQDYKAFQDQVGGHALMLTSKDNRKVLKKVIHINQVFFYQHIKTLHISHPHSRITQFIPKFIGCVDIANSFGSKQNNVTLDDNKTKSKIEKWQQFLKQASRTKQQNHEIYLQMYNFSYNYHSLNLIDIKVGQMPSRPSYDIGRNSNYLILSTRKTTQKGEKLFISRQQTKLFKTFKETNNLLAWFLISSQNKISKDLIQYYIQKLKQFSLSVRSFGGWNFRSASICLLYDTSDQKLVDVKFIDFGRVKCNQMIDQYDRSLIRGIDNLIMTLLQISQHASQYQKIEINYRNDFQFKQQKKNKKNVQSNQQKLRKLLQI